MNMPIHLDGINIQEEARKLLTTKTSKHKLNIIEDTRVRRCLGDEEDCITPGVSSDEDNSPPIKVAKQVSIQPSEEAKEDFAEVRPEATSAEQTNHIEASKDLEKPLSNDSKVHSHNKKKLKEIIVEVKEVEFEGELSNLESKIEDAGAILYEQNTEPPKEKSEPQNVSEDQEHKNLQEVNDDNEKTGHKISEPQEIDKPNEVIEPDEVEELDLEDKIEKHEDSKDCDQSCEFIQSPELIEQTPQFKGESASFEQTNEENKDDEVHIDTHNENSDTTQEQFIEKITDAVEMVPDEIQSITEFQQITETQGVSNLEAFLEPQQIIETQEVSNLHETPEPLSIIDNQEGNNEAVKEANEDVKIQNLEENQNSSELLVETLKQKESDVNPEIEEVKEQCRK